MKGAILHPMLDAFCPLTPPPIDAATHCVETFLLSPHALLSVFGIKLIRENVFMN